MAMEESKMNQLIWANFTDEELMGQHRKIMSTLTPEQIMMLFKYNVPAPFFESVVNMLSGFMQKNDYQDLISALN